MKKDIKYEILNKKYVNDALSIVLNAYKEERNNIPYLPGEIDFEEPLKKAIENIFHDGLGIIALLNGKLIGFLAGYELDEFFGACKGIYCPVYGHGINKQFPSLYKELYMRASELWVKQECLTHAITVYAHEEQTINDWYWMGFGLRCVDSIRETKELNVKNSSIQVKKIAMDDIPGMADIHREHHLYYKKSPMFMPRIEEDPIQDLSEWLNHDNHHLWGAYKDNKPLGYMRIQPNAESFISHHKTIMNVTGAYVLKTERSLGVGALLLNEIQTWLGENDYPLCGVDFESINVLGSGFWNKYFTPYTFSIVRRIDERIINNK